MGILSSDWLQAVSGISASILRKLASTQETYGELGSPPLQKEQQYYWDIQVVLTEYHELKKRVSFELSHERKKYVMTYSFSHGKKAMKNKWDKKRKTDSP